MLGVVYKPWNYAVPTWFSDPIALRADFSQRPRAMSTTLFAPEKEKANVDDKNYDVDTKSSLDEDSIPELGTPYRSSVTERTVGLARLWRRNKVDLDAIATQPSVFDNPVTLEVYRPPPVFENVHRFDPLARWTWREEKVSVSVVIDPRHQSPYLRYPIQSVIRKIDFRIMIWAFIMFFSLEMDRSNLSQANTDNFLGDLKLNTNDFNLGNILFKLSFLLAGDCVILGPRVRQAHEFL